MQSVVIIIAFFLFCFSISPISSFYLLFLFSFNLISPYSHFFSSNNFFLSLSFLLFFLFSYFFLFFYYSYYFFFFLPHLNIYFLSFYLPIVNNISVSMKTLFGKARAKKDGSDSLIKELPSIRDLQTMPGDIAMQYHFILHAFFYSSISPISSFYLLFLFSFNLISPYSRFFSSIDFFLSLSFLLFLFSYFFLFITPIISYFFFRISIFIFFLFTFRL